MKNLVDSMEPFAQDGTLNVVVETPMGSRNKYSYDPECSVFRLKKILPKGMAFPFDFGFLPCTVGGDGDALDALVITAEPAYPGSVVNARVLGLMAVEQTKEGKWLRNDRVLAEAILGNALSPGELPRLDSKMMDQIEQFFASYNRLEGKEFRVLSRGGAEEARRAIIEAHTRFKSRNRPAD